MQNSNEISIQGDLDTIFDLATRVEDWGRILPHYRYVKLLHQEGQRKWVRMSAWRDIVPVTWTAIQTVEPGENGTPGRIAFRHIRGLVRGMEVEWWFRPRPEECDVLVGINHRLDTLPFPTRILGPKLVEIVVARGFIGNIAGKTLRRVKEIAEQASQGGEPQQVTRFDFE
jgi:ribosome-associated toxin RatA of RatAB toxin-antitoxin module